jgi:hypothetical protein
VRGLNGKEVELVHRIKKSKVKIVAVTETKKRGHGIETLENVFTLSRSWVSKTLRTKAGVECLIHKDCVNEITHWNFINERLMTVNIKVDGEKECTLTIACGPNEMKMLK